ncbi:MAG TPA: hypothetical protein PKI60_01570 [Oscillospiraceae bacterium]|nr:hypothetical protein [Oscillospiraceae bacterium]
MNTTIISLSVSNLSDYDDEQRIVNFFEGKDFINKVTVNIADRNIIVSGDNITKESVAILLSEIGFEVA